MGLRAVIADDEKLARDLILEYLEAFPEVEVVAQCDNGVTAVEIINKLRPDLVFLDVQMPGSSGFEVLEKIEEIPLIIFSTAYSQYAIRAFEVSAVDYLLKPYSQERFDRAVAAALKQGGRFGDMSEKLVNLMREVRQNRQPVQRLLVKSGDRIVPVDTSAVEWLEAEGDYTRLHTETKTHLVGQTLSHLITLLDPASFIRIHRSNVVNLHYIKEIQKTFKGNYIVLMNSGVELPVGRTWLKDLKEKII